MVRYDSRRLCVVRTGKLRPHDFQTSSSGSAGIAQLARASAFQAEGRGFESRFPLQNNAHIAQSAEHFLGKEEVTGSNPVVGSIVRKSI